jgi:hypothetical protein
MRTSCYNLQLVANTAILGLGAPLIYDVSFTNVLYVGTSQREVGRYRFCAGWWGGGLVRIG